MDRDKGISHGFSSQEDIDKYLHPKKRSNISMVLDIHKDIFAEKKNIFIYLFYGLCGGLLPVLSALAIYYILSLIGSMEIEQRLSQAYPILISVGLYCLAYLILSIIKIQLEKRQEIRIRSYRMDLFKKIFYKKSTMDMDLATDARVENSLGDYLTAIQSINTGYEGILIQVFHMLPYLFVFLVFSFILFQVSPWIPIIAIIFIFIWSLADSIYNKYYKDQVINLIKNDRTFDRFNRIGQDFNYGKDIRIFSMEGVFSHINKALLFSFTSLLKKLRIRKALSSIPKAIAFAILDIAIIYIVAKDFSIGDIGAAGLVMVLSITSIYIIQIMSILDAISFIYNENVSLSTY